MGANNMKRSKHPEAYDWAILCGKTPEQVEGALDSVVIGLWNAHADLRAEGKLPASAIPKEDADKIIESVINEKI